MTVEDAKKIARLEDALEFFKKQSMLEQVVSNDEKSRYFSLAVDALGKQIPKKPIKKNPICFQRTIDGVEFYSYDYHCALCDAKLRASIDHHCFCGQTIDWSDTE